MASTIRRFAQEGEGTLAPWDPTQKLVVSGVYHSHAEVGVYFSELDQEFALQPGFPFPDAQHVVVSVVDGLVKEAAIFERSESELPFEGRLLVSEAP